MLCRRFLLFTWNMNRFTESESIPLSMKKSSEPMILQLCIYFTVVLFYAI